MSLISKRAFNKAYKLALADHKIPASENYITYKYGEGYNAEYGLYWHTLDCYAPFRIASDGYVILGHSEQTAKTSHFVCNMKDWQPE